MSGSLYGRPGATANGEIRLPSSSQFIGRRVGDWVVTQPMALGDHSEVFRIKHSRTNSPAVIKVARKDREDSAVKAFTTQGKLLESLKDDAHPKIIKTAVIEGRPYMIQSLRTGEPVGPHLERPLNALRVFAVCVDIIGTLHRHDFVHNRISTDSFLFDPETGVVSLLSLGANLQLNWSTRLFARKPKNAEPVLPRLFPVTAPEVHAGKRGSKATDIFALGVLGHLLLTGRLPYTDDHPKTILKEQRKPLPNHFKSMKVDQVVARTLEQAMHINPAERFEEAGAMSDQLFARLGQLT